MSKPFYVVQKELNVSTDVDVLKIPQVTMNAEVVVVKPNQFKLENGFVEGNILFIHFDMPPTPVSVKQFKKFCYSIIAHLEAIQKEYDGYGNKINPIPFLDRKEGKDEPV